MALDPAATHRHRQLAERGDDLVDTTGVLLGGGGGARCCTLEIRAAG